jgi:DDE superfamily endonuclease
MPSLIVSSRPRNARELFNLRHAKARNVIERIFGVSKQHFRLMVEAPKYSLETQAKIIHAICILHNFIRVHNPDEDLDAPEVELDRQVPRQSAMDFGGSVTTEERNNVNTRRDDIARHMWAQYQEYIADIGDANP